MFCEQPFNYCEINNKGDVYTCCSHFINFYSIGNIYDTNFAEIWNGEKAQNFRQKLLNGDFSMCNDICNKKYGNDHKEKYQNNLLLSPPPPTV